MVFLNNSFETFAKLNANRISGNATVYVSNPWHPIAAAKISNIMMTEINTTTSLPISEVNGALKRGSAVEKTIVPADYALSFDIIPLATVAGEGSIIHYSGDESNVGPKGRMPGMMDGS